MSFLDKIKAAATKATPHEVSVPEWDGITVYVKSLSAGERYALEKDISKDVKNDGPALARIVCMCLCDKDGNAVFEYPQGIDEVHTLQAAGAQRVFNAALKYNGMRKEDIEELEKN